MDDFVPSMMSSGSNLQHCRSPHSQLGSFGRKCALHPSLKICFAKSKTPLWTHSYSPQLSFCQKAYEADEVLRTNIEKCTHHITTCARLSYWHQQLQSQWIRRFLVTMGEVSRWLRPCEIDIRLPNLAIPDPSWCHSSTLRSWRLLSRVCKINLALRSQTSQNKKTK